MQKINLLVFGCHTTGTSSVVSAINADSDMRIFRPRKIEEISEINYPVNGIICIEKEDFKLISQIISQDKFDKNFLIIELMRDPLSMYLSATNMHINYWVYIAVGLYTNRKLNTDFFYRYGNRNIFCEFFTEYKGLYSQIYINNAIRLLNVTRLMMPTIEMDYNGLYRLMNIIKDFFGLSKYTKDIPNNSPFSEQNRFIKNIKPLTLFLHDKSFNFMPYPIEFVEYYNINMEHIAFTVKRGAFPFGNFKSDVAFIPDPFFNIKEYIYKHSIDIINYNIDIENYLNDITHRFESAKKIIEIFKVDKEILLNIIKDSPNLKNKIKHFLIRHLEYYKIFHPKYLTYCNDSIKFYELCFEKLRL